MKSLPCAAAAALLAVQCGLPGASGFCGQAPALLRLPLGGKGAGMLTLRGGLPRATCAQRARVGMQAQDDAKEASAQAPAKQSETPVPSPAAPVAPAAAPAAAAAKTPPADADAGMTGEQTAPAGTNKYKDFEANWTPPTPSPDQTDPEEVVKQLLAALKNNNKPQPNAGLSTVLAFSSPSNPITQREPEFFFGMMQNSQYSLLLGRFDTFRVVGTEDLSNTGAGYGAETVAVQLELAAPTQTMMDAGVDFNFMDSSAGKDTSTVSLKWQLSKSEETGMLEY